MFYRACQLLLILLCLPFIITAQSSLYQDAKAIGTFLKESATPKITFKLADGAKPVIGLYGDWLPQDQMTLEPESLEEYGLTTDQPDTTHQIVFDLLDTTILVMLTPGDTLEFFYDYKGYRGYPGVEIKDRKVPTPIFRRAFTSFAEQNGTDFFSYEMLSRLAAHSYFDDLESPDFSFDSKRLLKTYRGNPFLPAEWYANPVLQDAASFGYSLFWGEKDKEDEEVLREIFHQQYPWQRLLNGDSTLQLGQTVSFQEVTSSYRQPITSKRALDISSDQINRTSRDRGLLDARTVATGLSDFIAERAQEELNLTFFHRFKENLSRPSELTYLFPETSKLLQKFEISNYKTLLANARESFSVDLNNLGVNFPKILTLDKYEALNNDPNVFNLSLIYSVADLAYKDYPIEDILFSAHQILAERQVNLQRSIHQQLADTLHFFSTENVDLKNVPIVRDVQGQPMATNQLLNTMRSLTVDYLNDVEQLAWKLESFGTEALDTIGFNEMDATGMLSLSAGPSDGYLASRLARLARANVQTDHKLVAESYRYLEMVGLQRGDNIEYQNRTLDNYYTDFDHYSLLIPAHLSGREYYGHILENPRQEDHQEYFLRSPQPQKQYYSQGMDEARIMLNRGYGKKAKAYHLLMTQALGKWKAIRKDRLMLEGKDQEQLDQLFAFERRYQGLINRVEYELEFWKYLTDLDEEDHYIAGLEFLYNYINATDEEDDNGTSDSGISGPDEEEAKTVSVAAADIAPLLSFCHHMRATPDQYARVLSNEYEFEKLRQDFSAVLSRAHEHLDFIEQGLTQQVRLLLGQFGRGTATRYELADADREGTYWSDYFQLEFEREVYEEAALLRFIELSGDTLDPRGSYRYYLSKANENDEQWQLQMVNFDAQENKLDEFYEKEPQIDQAEEAITIQSWYLENVQPERFYLPDPPALKTDETLMADIHQAEAELNQMGAELDDILEQERSLLALFDSMAMTFSPKLVAAQQNAKNLAKSLELTTHLLMAFRDYEHTYQPLYQNDTVRVEVTTSQLDSIGGGTKMLRSDTFRINQTLIPEINQQQAVGRWISREQFNALRNDPLQWNMFLALLYQRLSSVEDAPKFVQDGVILLATKFVQIANEVAQSRQQLRRKRAEQPDDLGFKDYYPFIRSTVDLFNTMLSTNTIENKDTSTLIQTFTDQGPTYQPLSKISEISNEALSLYENIYVKNYGNAVLNAMQLLRVLTENQLDKKGRAQSGRAINAVLTYGTFMANLINAETSDQVKVILQSVTLPPGSSRIKREVTSNFTINSYLGVTAGQDRLIGAPSDLEQAALGAALSVPVGMTYSFSPNFIKNSSSFSFHIPLLDLGAITAFRQNPEQDNYNIDALPEFSWENLFSPGLFLVYNFSNSPFSLGVGGQYGPQLREINVDNGEPLFVNSWRFPQVFFNIDVPLFNLHTGARKIIVD